MINNMYNNDKYKNSLKGYFKLRSKGLSHLESLKHISNSKIKRKIDYKIMLHALLIYCLVTCND